MRDESDPYHGSSLLSRSPASAWLAVWISFVLLSVIGVLCVYGYWADRGRVQAAVLRSVIFVGIMAGVHFVGYRGWKRSQKDDPRGPESTPPKTDALPRPKVIWLVVSVVFLAAAAVQFCVYLATVAEARRWEQAGRSMPPTMISEHAGMAIALLCIGLIFMIVAFRPRNAGHRAPPGS